MCMEDFEAVHATLQGSRDAFGDIVKRYHRPLYYFVVGKISADGEAEDIVQKTFISAYERLPDYDRNQPLLAWLRGIALNHCRNAWRSYHRQAEMMNRLLDVKRAELEMDLLEESPQDERRAMALRQCLENLSETEQKAIRLRFVEEAPLADIGAALNRNGEAARQFLFRIRTRLHACIRKRLQMQETRR
jgi:RNA polymerase sigma-70 factor, ECF subfamily